MRVEELKNLLEKMSLPEKVGQMVQLMETFYQSNVKEILTGPARESGVSEEEINRAGSILVTVGAQRLIQIQKIYMEKQPHHIPMLFMMDVIHGMKTIFPIPLAQGGNIQSKAGRTMCIRHGERSCGMWAACHLCANG